MKLYLAALLVCTLLLSAYASRRNDDDDDDKDSKKDKKDRKNRRKDIKDLEDRLETVYERIDELNTNVCQSGTETSVLCDLPHERSEKDKDGKDDDVKKTAKCIFGPACGKNYKKKDTVKFDKALESNPVIVVAASGASYFCGADFELDSVWNDKKQFKLLTKSEYFVSPFHVQADYFACPEALNYKH